VKIRTGDAWAATLVLDRELFQASVLEQGGDELDVLIIYFGWPGGDSSLAITITDYSPYD
jgi:hypothetical protein